MGLVRWSGRQLAKPVTLRFRAYSDIWVGVKAFKRSIARAMPGQKKKHPPLLPGTAGASIDTIYSRWNRLNHAQRRAAWSEYQKVLPTYLRQSAANSNRDWSLSLNGSRRAQRYATTNAALKRSVAFYLVLMLIPMVFVVKHGGGLLYWINLLAASLLLAPAPLRLLILRAQVFHGGKVTIKELLQRYPSELMIANDIEDADKEQSPLQQLPQLSYLYGLNLNEDQQA